MKGKVIIISGPSGVGKSTLIKRVAERLGAVVSVSATTRRPGPAERHGEHYYFYSRQDFETLRREDRLLEWAEYLGNYYGTPRDPVEQALNRGTDVILGIETRGAKEVVKIFPDAIIICLSPPSDEELERRLRDRARDDEENPLSLQVPDAGPPVAKKYELAQIRKRIEAALERVPEELRELFVLRHINEFSYEEIAEIKDLPVGTVKNRVFQTKEIHRSLWEEGT